MIDLRKMIFVFGSLLLGFMALGGMPEKLADFNLNSKRESEKIGVSFFKANETAGALGKGIFISPGGFIRIPTYPSFRTEAMTPELNFNQERGTLEFCFSPIDDLNGESKKFVLFACNSIGGENSGMTCIYNAGHFVFELRDEEGRNLKAESKSFDLRAGKFYHLALAWRLGGRGEDTVLKIYLDGKIIAESNGHIGLPGVAPSDFFIASDSGRDSLVGVYDEIKIWSVELDKFEIKEDSMEDKLKKSSPIWTENFNGFPAEKLVCDKFFGKCFLLPSELSIDAVLGTYQGMLEFWMKPMALQPGSSEICRIGNRIELGSLDGKICLKSDGQILKTDAKFGMKKWNALSIVWNLRSRNISLYLNGKKIGSLKLDKKIPIDSRFEFCMKKGRALLKGVRVWHLALPEKNIYKKGVRLTGNFASDFQSLLEYDVPVVLNGDYTYSEAVDGQKEAGGGKGPFAFSAGKLTDGKIGVANADRVSYYDSRESVFDLKKVFYVTEVVVCCASRPNWHLKDVEFFTSLDSKKWIQAGTATDNVSEYASALIVPYAQEIGRNARFIKIKTRSKEKCLTSIAEVLIFGLPSKVGSRIGKKK